MNLQLYPRGSQSIDASSFDREEQVFFFFFFGQIILDVIKLNVSFSFSFIIFHFILHHNIMLITNLSLLKLQPSFS